MIELDRTGWKEDKAHVGCDKLLYKVIETPTKCHCNNSKGGITVTIKLHSLHVWGVEQKSYDVGICAELLGEDWVNLKVYGLTTIADCLKHVKRLVSTWEHMASWKG